MPRDDVIFLKKIFEKTTVDEEFAIIMPIPAVVIVLNEILLFDDERRRIHTVSEKLFFIIVLLFEEKPSSRESQRLIDNVLFLIRFLQE